MEGCMEGWMVECMDGYRWMDGWVDGYICLHAAMHACICLYLFV